MTARLVPAAEGRPAWMSTAGSTRSASGPAQPLAPGAGNVLSTSELPLKTLIFPAALNSSLPEVPVSGSMPAGGLVVPVVRCGVSGSAGDPT